MKPFEILRTKDPIAKELNLSSETPPDALIAAIAQNPGLLQRPIVEIGDRAVLARPAEKVIDLLRETNII
jgi:arsenate reductase